MEPKVALEHFSAILGIARPSGREEGVIAYISQWAEQRGYKVTVDQFRNCVIHVPGTSGYENAKSVCLQAHTDMVYVPGDQATIQTPIDIEIDGDWVQSFGQKRTLGADNSAGIVLSLDAVETCRVHPPLEILLTSDEEGDFTGANNFDPKKHDMRSRLLINLDTPLTRRIAVMSAGYLDVLALFYPERELKAAGSCFRISLSGLAGGHSGDNIAENRGNAIKAMAGLLRLLPDGARIVDLSGGAAGNSIPAIAEATVHILGKDQEWTKFLGSAVAMLRQHLRRPEIELDIEECVSERPALTSEASANLIDLLGSVPSGVERMSTLDPDVPELSSTVAVVSEREGVLCFHHIVRGAEDTYLKALASKVACAYALHGCMTDFGHGSGGWKQEAGSALVESAIRAFKALEKPAQLRGFHCALELAALIGPPEARNFDAAVSFGAQVDNEHGVNERMSLSSLRLARDVLHLVLADVAEGRV